MKIYINGRFLTQKVTGVQRYARELLKALDDIVINNNLDDTIVLLCPQKSDDKFMLKKIKLKKVGIFNGQLWEQFELPFYSFNGVLVNLCNTAPIFHLNKIITIHDTGVFATPNAYSTKFRLWYKAFFQMITRSAKKVITVSNFSKSELIRYCNIHGENIIIIPPGQEHLQKYKSDNSILDKFYRDNYKYILAVSSLNPNKNFKNIILAISHMKTINVQLVVAGGMNNAIFNTKDMSDSNNVSWVGYVTDEELKSLYENAECFIFPSLYEGFGIPPIEAMKFGCPAIVSRKASLPEVCDNAAMYCDADNPIDIADCIDALLNDNQLKNDFIKKGYLQASKYKWKSSACKLINVILNIDKRKM